MTLVSTFPLNQTGIVSIWTEALVYGMFLPIFCTALYVLVCRHGIRKETEKINKAMLCTALLMFALATAHLGVDAWRMMTAYVYLARGQVDEPSAFFRDMGQPTFSAKYSIYVSQNLVGDAFNIYRSWLVWQRNPWILAPLITLWAAAAASGYYCTAYLFSTADDDDSLFNAPYEAWITTFYVLALAQNIISTTLITIRLWDRERNMMKGRKGRLTLIPILRIVVESAILFLCAQLVLLVLFAVNSNAQYIILESLCSLTGIAFSLVIIRVAIHSQHFLVISPPSSALGSA
ncbi:hypothetical protein CALCODRAFT_358637 [Calocera cornea HHB12733]|uniref:Fungal pheromone STE3G-protein-coupled receptor n=1 Tax=Calocera cornea HHB12733 TaxID=1353952 RepID=A0A165EN80_9BASI|nr:hypothetical protein CALCODRAFT_358637 [Calocera cornea HHB12733]